jgi:hypothetical protein
LNIYRWFLANCVKLLLCWSSFFFFLLLVFYVNFINAVSAIHKVSVEAIFISINLYTLVKDLKLIQLRIFYIYHQGTSLLLWYFRALPIQIKFKFPRYHIISSLNPKLLKRIFHISFLLLFKRIPCQAWILKW